MLEHGKSLLPVGITGVTGSFERGQTVRLLDPDSREMGRGVTNYNSTDLIAIQGRQSGAVSTILGYEYGPTVIHRDDLVLV